MNARIRESQRLQARAARREVEDAIAAAGWPWTRRLSRHLDFLIVIEESDR